MSANLESNESSGKQNERRGKAPNRSGRQSSRPNHKSIDRRNFLKGLAITAAVAGTGGLAPILRPQTGSTPPASGGTTPAPIDLNGSWVDNGRALIMTHDVAGKTVRGNYVKDYDCRGLKTKSDLNGTVSGDIVEGTTTTCKYDDTVNPPKGAFVNEKIKLQLSADGQKLVGDPAQMRGWFKSSANQWQPVTIVRACPTNIELDGQLKAAANDPKKLLTLCQSLLDRGISEECLHPYAAVADCFGPGAHLVEMQQTTGPGLIGYPLVILGLSGPGAVPKVPVVSPNLYRDPMLITRDVSAALLFILKKAKEIMAATAIYSSDLGNQTQVIQCVEELCNSMGFPTFFT